MPGKNPNLDAKDFGMISLENFEQIAQKIPSVTEVINHPMSIVYKFAKNIENAIPKSKMISVIISPNHHPFTIKVPPTIVPRAPPIGCIVKNREFVNVGSSLSTIFGMRYVR